MEEGGGGRAGWGTSARNGCRRRWTREPRELRERSVPRPAVAVWRHEAAIGARAPGRARAHPLGAPRFEERSPEGEVGQARFHKTMLCKYSPASRCKRGQFCPFAHGVDELRPRPELRKRIRGAPPPRGGSGWPLGCKAPGLAESAQGDHEEQQPKEVTELGREDTAAVAERSAAEAPAHLRGEEAASSPSG